MNIGMDLSNMLVGKIPNTLLQGKQDIKMNNRTFGNMLNMLMVENEMIQSTSSHNPNIDSGLMALFDTNNLMNPNICKNTAAFMLHMADMEGAWMGAVEETGEENRGQDFAYPAELIPMMNYFEYFNYDSSVSTGNISEMDKITEFMELQYKPAATEGFSPNEMTQRQAVEASPEQNFSETMIKNIKNEEAPLLKEEKEKNFDATVNMNTAPEATAMHGEKIIVNISDEASQLKPQILNQVGDRIKVMAEKGEAPGSIKHVEMELNPEHLGKINIKMIFDNDKITVEIKAINKETQKILSSGTGELSEILKKSTDLPIGIVVKNDENQGKGLQSHYNSWNENNGNNEKYDQQGGRGRQRNSYYNEDAGKENDEESIFSELINIRSMKLNI